jgi:hypothetical protein
LRMISRAAPGFLLRIVTAGMCEPSREELLYHATG